MHVLGKQQILSAAMIVIAASLIFSCETRKTEFQAGHNVQPGRQNYSHRKGNDAAFLVAASNDMKLQAQLAELAVRKSASPLVREFAISVLTDHSIAMDEISEMASRIEVVLPPEIPTAHRRHYLRIAKKSGLQFDRAFCDLIFLNNSIVLKKFEKIVQEGNSELLKDWAWRKLGILKRHIAMSQNIEGKGSAASIDVAQ